MIPSLSKSDASEIASLQRKIDLNPVSPVVTRLASLYLDENRLDEARTLCEKGVTHYPEYATAHLILGKCYLRLQRFADARTQLEQTLALQPQCKVAQDLLREDAFTVADGPNSTMKEFESSASSVPADIPSPPIEDARTMNGDLVDWDPSGGIATATLAEIYATQGAYREAIRTYSLLVHRKPEDRERFEQRIKELEEKWREIEPPS